MTNTDNAREAEMDDLDTRIAKEFRLLNFAAKPSDIARLSDALFLQGAEYDEIAIMAACTAYAAARGKVFA